MIITDLWNSIKAQLYERTNNPITGSFLISWIIWNYKFIALMFSSEKILKKYELIECTLYPDWVAYFLYWFLYPATSTVLIIFLLPYPTKIAYQFTKKKQKELQDLKREIESNSLLTRDEAIKLKADIFSLESKYNTEIKTKDSEINDLKLIVEQLEVEKSSSKQLVGDDGIKEDKTSENKNNSELVSSKYSVEAMTELDEPAIDILLLVSVNEGEMDKSVIINYFKNKYSSLKITHYIDELFIADMVTTKSFRYELTIKSRAFIVRHNLLIDPDKDDAKRKD